MWRSTLSLIVWCIARVMLFICRIAVHVELWCRKGTVSIQDEYEDEFNITTIEYIRKCEYPVEEHTVETEDRYLLKLHRIPHGRDRNINNGPPVLVHHGLLCSSFDWVALGPKRSLGFVLADAGYDVWLANNRGNTYSRIHRTMDPADEKFWEFSWDEMGTYDIPAEIDYILNTTGHKKLFYIGHSTGTTMFFVMASQRPEYNDKIQAMIAFAPVTTFTPATNEWKFIAQNLSEVILEKFFDVVGYHEFLPLNSVLNELSSLAVEKTFIRRFCFRLMNWINGKSRQIDKKRLILMLKHTPAGSSTRTVMHFAQEKLSGKFCRYDYGKDKNFKMYGQPTPPTYNTKNIRAPIYLYFCDGDNLARPHNVRKLFSELPNVIGMHRVPLKLFSHIDFMWGKDANEVVYQHVIRTMDSRKTL